ncbi:MAG: hypothetical protein IKD04_01935 [Clostridia bacterium]|nr:hypothetical protein [Clostridia bacterium]
MANNKTGINMDDALRRICRTYPFIDLNYLQLFSKVYYPIAVIDAGISEESYEDFTAVERAVLKFYDAGFCSMEEISGFMGLTTRYVAQITKLLRSYCYLDDTLAVTKLGKQSLAANRKILPKSMRQTFEVDAVNGYPLRLGRTAYSEEDFEKHIAYSVVIGGIDFTDTATVISRFNDGCDMALRNRARSSISVNVTGISDPQFVGIKYAAAYLIQLEGYEPLIFADIEISEDGKQPYFLWQPFGIGEEKTARMLGLQYPVYNTAQGQEIVNNAALQVSELAMKEASRERFKSGIEYYLNEGLKLRPEFTEQVSDHRFIISGRALTEYNFDVLKLLTGLGSVNNIYTYSYPSYAGNFASFSRDTADKRLAFVCQYLKILAEQTPLNELNIMLEAAFSENDTQTDLLLGISKELGIQNELPKA